MEVWVFGVAGGELAVSNVNGFVGLTLGAVRVEHDVLFGGDRVPAQALARFEVVAKLVLAEGLGAVLEDGASDPSSHAVALSVGADEVLVAGVLLDFIRDPLTRGDSGIGLSPDLVWFTPRTPAVDPEYYLPTCPLAPMGR